MRGIVSNISSRSFGAGSNARIGTESLRRRWPSLWRARKRRYRDKRAVAALQALDERLLKDIGIERSEIESVVRGLARDASRVKRT